MKTGWLTLVSTPLFWLAFAAPPATTALSGPGAVIAVGGGGTPDAVVLRALELAGGPSASVVILPQASRRTNRGQGSTKLFAKAEAENVRLLELTDPAAATRVLAEADLIWFPGGSQSQLIKALRGAKLVDVIRKAHARGAVVGGTSAGAAVLSLRMITGESDLEAITHERTEIAEGLALWPTAIVDQHFLARRRNNRLLAAVLDHPSSLGVGVDERTAVIVRGERFEVLGEGSVVVYDARSAKVEPAGAGEAHAATDVRLHVLTSGASFKWSE